MNTQTFNRYLFKELLSNFLAVFFILQIIITSNLLIRLLEDTTDGKYSYDVLFWVITYISLDAIVIILPFSAMLTVLLTLGRYHRDNESYAAFSIGIGHWQISKIILSFVLPLAVFLAVFMLELSPALKLQYEKIHISFEQGINIGAMGAGRFINTEQGLVIFAEKFNRENNELEGIFIARENESIIEIAKRGKQKTLDNGDKHFYLYQGHRYQGVPGETKFHSAAFDEHWIQLPTTQLQFDDKDTKMRSFRNLLDSTQLNDKAELQRRLSMPVALVLLSMFAFVISKTSQQRNVRSGRYIQLTMGILFFLIYSNTTILLTKLGANHVGFLYLVWLVQIALAIFILFSLSSFRGKATASHLRVAS